MEDVIQVRFENGHTAPLLRGADGANPRALLGALRLPAESPRPVLVVSGGADELDGAELALAEGVVGPAVAEAARLTGAAVVDGGTAAGVMAVVGRARAAHRGSPGVLLGVAPVGRVTYPGGPDGDRAPLESHHTHFLLANSAEWGGETQLLADVAEALAAGGGIAMVLAGGGVVAHAEAAEAVRRGWPVIAVAGTGGAADALAASGGTHRVRVFRGDEPRQLARVLAWELQDEPALKDAWRAFGTCNELAVRTRRSFERTQAAILLLGVLATLLALVYDVVGGAALHWAVVAVPILAAALIALSNRRAGGRRWVLLRGAAEAIKTELYRYRTRTGAYRGPDRGAALAAQLGAVETQLLATEGSSGPLTPYDGPLPPEMYGAARDDDGLSPLDAEGYIGLRIGDQLSYYHGKIADLDRRRTVFQVLSIGAGGAGAILAAAGLEVWIGVTTAIGAGALAYLGTLQADATIVAYNQAAGRLAALRREWSVRPGDLEALVTRGESVLGTELGGWVEQMSETLEALQARQAGDAKRIESS